MSQRNINIDSALDLLNSQINSIAERINVNRKEHIRAYSINNSHNNNSINSNSVNNSINNSHNNNSVNNSINNNSINNNNNSVNNSINNNSINNSHNSNTNCNNSSNNNSNNNSINNSHNSNTNCNNSSNNTSNNNNTSSNKLYINLDQFSHKSLDDSEDEDDFVMDTTITSENHNYTSTKTKLFGTNQLNTSNTSNTSRTSLSSLLLNEDIITTNRNISHGPGSENSRLVHTVSFESSRRNSTDNSTYSKPLFGLSRNNSRLKNSSNHYYLDSTNNNSNLSSPFMKPGSQCGSSPFLSNNSSPFNKNSHISAGISHSGNNTAFNNMKRTSMSTSSSFKRSSSIKRSNSLKKYSSSTGNSNSLITNLQSKLELEVKAKIGSSVVKSCPEKVVEETGRSNDQFEQLNYKTEQNNGETGRNNDQFEQLNYKTEQNNGVSGRNSDETGRNSDGTGRNNYGTGRNNDASDKLTDYSDKLTDAAEQNNNLYDFISKRPPPLPLLAPYSSGSANQVTCLSSSNTGSSVNSAQFGLFAIDSDQESRETTLQHKYLDTRADLNKTPVATISNRILPKTPDKTNNLLYKLNTDLNFECESMEVMSAMSQTSFASTSDAFKQSTSMLLNKPDLLKMSSDLASSLFKENMEVSEENIEDYQLKKIIHLPTVQGNFKCNHDGITMIDSECLKNMIWKSKNSGLNDLLIVDCRFPKEYLNGHIKNSINIYDFSTLLDMLKNLLSSTSPAELVQHKIVFYCEFSQYRSPSLAKFLRKLDRLITIKYWPYLIFPDLFILEGGIFSFKESSPSLMVGSYCGMNDAYRLCSEELEMHLSVFRNHTASYLGSSAANDAKSSLNSGFQAFDKMVEAKNELMNVINSSFA